MWSVNGNEYTILNSLGESSYGIVYKVKNQEGDIFVFKKYISYGNRIPLGALREISILKKLQKLNPYPTNIIKLHDIIYDKKAEFIGIIIPLYKITLLSAIEKNKFTKELVVQYYLLN